MMLRSLSRTALLLLALAAAAPLEAKKSEVSADGLAKVTLVPIKTLDKESFHERLLEKSGFTGWGVGQTTGLPGDIFIQAYDAGWNFVFPELGGGGLLAYYEQAAAIPDGNELNWIQVIHTNRPLGGLTVPYLDPRPNDDTLPFYWTRDEADTYGDATTVGFSDFSTRDKAGLAIVDPIYWRAMLFPIYDDGFVITVGDGIRWGWNMRSRAVPAIPEPQSWALMIVGFGAIGAALRTRRIRSISLRFMA